MKLTVRPLTPDRLPALEDLFGEHGPCHPAGVCIGGSAMPIARGRAIKTRQRFENWSSDGPPPGLLAFDGDVAVGWCQLTPRDALPWLDRTWRLKRVDDVPVWSLSCFYVRKGYRKRGVTSALIAAALDAAKRAGASALEAYPLDANLTPSTSHTGYASTFARAGFKIVARHVPPRPIMRYDLKAITR